jgi:transcriptional regulator with XRE-family HTH domain
MKLGEKIRKSRKSSGISGSVLASQVGCCGSLISKIETSQHKGQPDPDIVSKIADALNDKSILTTYLENNPVYQSIIPTILSDMNNISPDLAIIFSRFASEAEDAVDAARTLSDIFSNVDLTRMPNFDAVLRVQLEQIVDVQRCSEMLLMQLIAADVITDADRGLIYSQQQKKCAEKELIAGAIDRVESFVDSFLDETDEGR